MRSLVFYLIFILAAILLKDAIKREKKFNSSLYAVIYFPQVANYRELFLFRKISVKKEKNKIAIDNKALDELKPEMMTVSMVDLVAKYFEKTSGNKADLKALGVRGIGDAVLKYGEKDDRDALTAVVRKQTKKASLI